MRRRGPLLVGAVMVVIAGGAAAGWFLTNPRSVSVTAVTAAAPAARPQHHRQASRASHAPHGAPERAPASTSTAPPAGRPEPRSGPAARAAVRRAWTAFFAGSTPLSAKERLLEDGRRFAHALRAMTRSPLARRASASVQHVGLHKNGSASVRYSLLLNGKPALTHRSGTALWRGGTWKVADTSFCALAALEGQPPAACQHAAHHAGRGGGS